MILGVDFAAKWREATTLKLLVQSELWYRARTPLNAAAEKAIGLYVYPQYHLGWDFYAGMRLDYYSVLSLQDAFGTVSRTSSSICAALGLSPSEFTTFRLAYNIRPEYLDNR